MGTEVSEGVEVSVDVEDTDFPAGDLDDFPLARGQVGGICNDVSSLSTKVRVHRVPWHFRPSPGAEGVRRIR